tara:strand:+ start:41913 stop:42419 length:507 start_codon:yes stop_codon:yes gene_type:complete
MFDPEKAKPIIQELKLESDRALVLITAAHVENELYKHLEHRLLPKLDKKDELLHRADFETKIILAYRTGVITEGELKIYNQLRQLRNKCAHDVSEQSFKTVKFQHRIKNIMKYSPEIWKALAQGKELEDFIQELGWREAFILFFSMIIMHKRQSYNRVTPLRPLSKKT